MAVEIAVASRKAGRPCRSCHVGNHMAQAIVISAKTPQLQNASHNTTKGEQLSRELTTHNDELLGNKL